VETIAEVCELIIRHHQVAFGVMENQLNVKTFAKDHHEHSCTIVNFYLYLGIEGLKSPRIVALVA
jgi:hypothetical protein